MNITKFFFSNMFAALRENTTVTSVVMLLCYSAVGIVNTGVWASVLTMKFHHYFHKKDPQLYFSLTFCNLSSSCVTHQLLQHHSSVSRYSHHVLLYIRITVFFLLVSVNHSIICFSQSPLQCSSVCSSAAAPVGGTGSTERRQTDRLFGLQLRAIVVWGQRSQSRESKTETRSQQKANYHAL